MNKKKILLVSPPFIATSKNSLAGTEQMVYNLGKALNESGHEVLTIARDDSEVSGKLIPGSFKKSKQTDKSSFQEYSNQVISYQEQIVRDTIKKESNLDYIIDNFNATGLRASLELNGPKVINWLHLTPNYFLNSFFFNRFKQNMISRNDQLVSVSNVISELHKSHYDLGELENNLSTIHNGIIAEEFEFNEQPKDYLLYLGRIRDLKGPHIALRVAKELNKKIIVAGGPKDMSDQQYLDNDYFQKEIAPYLNSSLVEWYGPANFKEKIELMKNAQAVLFPIQWDEPFGLVPIEAGACGTPTISYNRAGPKETIVDGKTGYLANDYEQFVTAVKNIDQINRFDCREHVLNNFDYKVMGKQFEKLMSDEQ